MKRFTDVLVILPHYASDSVMKYNKDESIFIAKNGIATFISALQIYWIKNQEWITIVALTRLQSDILFPLIY